MGTPNGSYVWQGISMPVQALQDMQQAAQVQQAQWRTSRSGLNVRVGALQGFALLSKEKRSIGRCSRRTAEV